MSRPIARGWVKIRVQDLVDTIVEVLKEDVDEGFVFVDDGGAGRIAEEIAHLLIEERPREAGDGG